MGRGDDVPWDLKGQFTDLAAAEIIELSPQALHETRKLVKDGCGEVRRPEGRERGRDSEYIEDYAVVESASHEAGSSLKET